MDLKWRQLVVLDSVPLFFLSTRCLPFTDTSIYVHISVGTTLNVETTPVKWDAVDHVG